MGERIVNCLGFLDGKWLVMDVGDSRVKVEAVGLTDSDVEALDLQSIGTPEEERQKTIDPYDAKSPRQIEDEKAKEVEYNRSNQARELVAAEPATLKRINLIAKVAKDLNRAADEATLYIEGVENYLEAMGYGIEVVGECFVKAKDERSAAPHLRYSKETGCWCIVLHGGKSPVPLKNASRAGRILAAKHIPALLEAMWERIVGEAEKITEHKKAFSDDVNDKAWERE